MRPHFTYDLPFVLLCNFQLERRVCNAVLYEGLAAQRRVRDKLDGGSVALVQGPAACGPGPLCGERVQLESVASP